MKTQSLLRTLIKKPRAMQSLIDQASKPSTKRSKERAKARAKHKELGKVTISSDALHKMDMKK